MGKMQREKGARFERLVVNLAKGKTLDAERTAPMQAGSGETRHGDVRIEGWSVECKHHQRVSVVSYDDWTNKPRRVLVYQHNNGRPKAVLDLDDFLELASLEKEVANG